MPVPLRRLLPKQRCGRAYLVRKPSALHGAAFARPEGLRMRDGTAAEIVDVALNKAELVIHAGNLPATAEALRDLLAGSGKLFERGVPVRIVTPADGSLPTAMPLTKNNIVIETHRL